MKKIKFSLLILNLFVWFAGNATCFDMTVTPLPSPIGSDCYEVSIELINGPYVIVSDGFHQDEFCDASCNFIWCYESSPNQPYSVRITCQSYTITPTPPSDCLQQDGCIVIID